MSQPQQTSRMAVLLFTDMVDSVGLERRLGTEAYSRLLKTHHQLFRQSMELVGAGKIHLDTGDGFLGEFSTAGDAVNVALLFQKFLHDYQWETERPRVRTGLHQGQLAEIRVDPAGSGKIVGMPVNIASRVMNIAEAGQILMTRPVYDDARQFIREHPIARVPGRSSPPLGWKAHGPYLFKGAEETLELFEVGVPGLAPLRPPANSEKGQRVLPAVEEMPRHRRALVGAAIATFCGLFLWATSIGDPWVNTSYDYLFRFSTRWPANPPSTNKIALVLMDDDSCQVLGQSRETWDRALHARLLNHLREAGARLVVFDVFFKERKDPTTDAALATAIRSHGRVALMSSSADSVHPGYAITNELTPAEIFLEAAADHGVGAVSGPGTARQHLPFPASAQEQIHSLPWVAARLAGTQLSDQPQKQWLRYYGDGAAWEALPYYLALTNNLAYFSNRIVFIGNQPANLNSGVPEKDKFNTPYNGKAVGGIEILATTFLNLLNGDWLRRPSELLEFVLLVLTGGLMGAGFCFLNRLIALLGALALALALMIIGVSLSYYTNYWFPWLIVVGAQVPSALIWSLVPLRGRARTGAGFEVATASNRDHGEPKASCDKIPDAPEYEIFDPPFGEGGFGKVWIVRNAIGQWQALKAVYQAKFGSNIGPYEAEFNGLQKYKPVSEKHGGLLRIDLISRRKEEGYFYYIMELGDSLVSGWEKEPGRYKPKDLESFRKQAYGRRLPVADCVRIGIVLADALEFLHREGLTHRDIKPSNIIFVQGRPKLADVGLVTDIRPPELVKTYVGTIGFVPPPPERPGTVQADIFSLGMVLYVISTGKDPVAFPELPNTLLEHSSGSEFIKLDRVILRACQPDAKERYQTAAAMLQDLEAAKLQGPD